MLLNQETKDKFGYDVTSLSLGSNKQIVLKCDYCSITYDTIIKRRTIAHKVIATDACPKCKYKKMEDMNKLKYGVANVFQLEDTKRKIVATNIEKYGVSAPQQSYEIRNKTKLACLEKYGVENSFQSEGVKAKIKATNLQRYGYENPSSNSDVKEKRKATNLEKYGHEYYLGSQDCHDKMVAIYGVDNVFEDQDIIDKIRKSRISSGNIEIYEGKDKKQWSEQIGVSYGHFSDLVSLYGWEKAITCVKHMTNLEQGIKDIIDDIGLPYKHDVTLGRYRPDFIIDNVIIEADGLFYHSDAVKEDNNYHVKKRISYIDSGFTPLFFRQHEILNKSDVVASIIKQAFGKNEIIDGSLLHVKEISCDEGKTFFNINSLIYDVGDKYFGLFNNDAILACLSIKNNVVDYTTINNYNVVDGFKNMISFIKNDYKVLTRYINLRYSLEKLLSAGFTPISHESNYEWTDGRVCLSSSAFPNNSGYENKFNKIWDCGQLKWVYQQ